MDQATMKHEIEQYQGRIRQLRDELKLKIHLGGMDAKTTFAELEKKAERASHEVNMTTHGILRDVSERLQRLVTSLETGT